MNQKDEKKLSLALINIRRHTKSISGMNQEVNI